MFTALGTSPTCEGTRTMFWASTLKPKQKHAIAAKKRLFFRTFNDAKRAGKEAIIMLVVALESHDGY